MKGFVILVIVLIIGFIIYAAGRKQEIEAKQKEKPAQSATQSVQNVQKPSQSAKKPASQNEQKPGKAGQMASEVGGVIDYGTGAAQIRAGNNAKNKIQNIQQQQQQRHQKELE